MRSSNFDELKKEIRDATIEDATVALKYARFLAKLVSQDAHRKALWYFSDNTDFCRQCVRNFAVAIEDLVTEYKAFRRDALPDTHLEFETLRRLMGSLFFYQFSALESFAQEANLFYGLGLRRNDVSLANVRRQIALDRPDSALDAHMAAMENKRGYALFRKYRNAVAHGYVFPLTFSQHAILVPLNPQEVPFSFDGPTTDLLQLTRESTSLADEYICQGWRCFESDELSPQGPIEESH